MLSFGRNLMQNAVLITFARKKYSRYFLVPYKKPEQRNQKMQSWHGQLGFLESLQHRHWGQVLGAAEVFPVPGQWPLLCGRRPSVTHSSVSRSASSQPSRSRWNAVCHQIFIVQIVFQGHGPGPGQVLWPLPRTPSSSQELICLRSQWKTNTPRE